MDRSAILPGLDPRSLPLNAIAFTTKTIIASLNVDISAVETSLDKKKTYEIGFEQAKKKCFISVDKSHIAIILELSSPEKIFEAFDKKYSATNTACLRQLLRDYQAIRTQKNVAVVEKYKAILNLNVKIRIQKPEPAFQDEHLINFLVASIRSTYGSENWRLTSIFLTKR